MKRMSKVVYVLTIVLVVMYLLFGIISYIYPDYRVDADKVGWLSIMSLILCIISLVIYVRSRNYYNPLDEVDEKDFENQKDYKGDSRPIMNNSEIISRIDRMCDMTCVSINSVAEAMTERINVLAERIPVREQEEYNSATDPSERAFLIIKDTALQLGAEIIDQDDEHYYIQYQGEHFLVLPDEESIKIYDIKWHSVELSNLDAVSATYKAIHMTNKQCVPKLVYNYDNEEHMMNIHSIHVLPIRLAAYINVTDLKYYLVEMLKAHHVFFNAMEEIRQEEHVRSENNRHENE